MDAEEALGSSGARDEFPGPRALPRLCPSDRRLAEARPVPAFSWTETQSSSRRKP